MLQLLEDQRKFELQKLNLLLEQQGIDIELKHNRQNIEILSNGSLWSSQCSSSSSATSRAKKSQVTSNSLIEAWLHDNRVDQLETAVCKLVSNRNKNSWRIQITQSRDRARDISKSNVDTTLNPNVTVKHFVDDTLNDYENYDLN